MATTIIERQCRRDEQLAGWGESRQIDVQHLDEGQKWAVFFALQLLAIVGTFRPLRRLVGYFLAHAGMGFGSTFIAALLEVSDRAIRYTNACTAEEIVDGIRNPVRGHRAPKLGPEQAGPLAKYLLEHPRAKVRDILEFVTNEFGVTMDRLTLRRYLARYGLGCLRGDTHVDAPLL
jgi:hypothetical protein